MSTFEGELENLLGEFHIKMKGKRALGILEVNINIELVLSGCIWVKSTTLRGSVYSTIVGMQLPNVSNI